mgnify:CR=1 FL=1|tara:strand:+ start:1851 stop:3095 length:1245 start_codon:yes stop_codon:yes gene_type:complete
MHRWLIKKISLFLILSFIIALIIFVPKKRNSSMYDLNTVEVSIPFNKTKLAIKAFNDFDNYFDLVYVDSTDYFNLYNVLKLVDLNNFKIKEAFLQYNNFDDLFNSFHEKISTVEYIENEMYLSSLNSFLSKLDYFLTNDIVYDEIGSDMIFSLLFNFYRQDSFNDSKIILNLNSNISCSDFAETMYKFNQKNFPIKYLKFNSKDIYNCFLENNDNANLSLFLEQHYWAFADDIHQLGQNVEKLNDIKNSSIIMYVNNETMIRGDRYRKIRNFSMNGLDKTKKKYLDRVSAYEILNNIKYLIQQKDYPISNYNLNELINVLVNNINKLSLTLKDKKIDARYLYLQDCYYRSYDDLSKHFVNLSPITLDYLNSSIKKKYYNSNNNMYIAKIYVNEKKYKKKKYINDIFNNKTNLLK